MSDIETMSEAQRYLVDSIAKSCGSVERAIHIVKSLYEEGSELLKLVGEHDGATPADEVKLLDVLSAIDPKLTRRPIGYWI